MRDIGTHMIDSFTDETDTEGTRRLSIRICSRGSLVRDHSLMC